MKTKKTAEQSSTVFFVVKFAIIIPAILRL